MIQRLLSLFRKKKTSCGLLFYGSHHVDEIWVRTTALESKRRGISVVVGIGTRLEDDIRKIYLDAGIIVLENLGALKLRSIETKIAVTASTGLTRKSFSPNLQLLIHMPHSIASLHMIYPADAFDGYDLLFSAGPHHDREMAAIAQKRGLSDFRGSIPIGYGKMDLLLQEKPVISKDFQKHILIAPSWGPGNILKNIGIELCRTLVDNGFAVTVRPHPMFFIERDSFLAEAAAEFTESEDFAVENSLGLGTAIFTADLLITDYSGIAQEFSALRGRPVVFVDGPQKILNPDWETLEIEPVELASRGVLGPAAPANTADVMNAVQDSLMRQDEWKRSAEDFQQFYLHPGSCAKNACDTLQNLLKENS